MLGGSPGSRVRRPVGLPRPARRSGIAQCAIISGQRGDVMTTKVPSYQDLMNPTLAALHELGGSGTNEEIAEKVIEMLDLPDDVVEQQHAETNTTAVEYRLAWARTYLKTIGLLESPKRKLWALTADGLKTKHVDPTEVTRTVRKLNKKPKKRKPADGDTGLDVEETEDWRTRLLGYLHDMDPIAFERLCQRLLRLSGFTEVEVTARTSDGGIDGHGILKLGLISFTVVFQAKRYQSNVGASVVRDFRGAMVGRADKGLIITTARFTRDARVEATRDGAPPIDLINGDDLVDRLKEVQLGVRVTQRVVEEVETDFPALDAI